VIYDIENKFRDTKKKGGYRYTRELAAAGPWRE